MMPIGYGLDFFRKNLAGAKVGTLGGIGNDRGNRASRLNNDFIPLWLLPGPGFWCRKIIKEY